ncbi:AraC family transcriptional regulator [Brasilonema octagenarum UFV-E1]|uniref:AraC family transcriptional regulator n=1 Tax=Brasilonema sennae CENA114 TaxID=415709 RepID=A0A856MPW3_9CYAN|nr:AraC family transcriptional regulator [Brasilonema sennae]QDL11046.1 AraC family transcriptional regulator [Brasilonema sennae CENA114]QDL17390.1 AraC family transcriptional regulator [Brasilonema octagenarum UFV-E1]
MTITLTQKDSAQLWAEAEQNSTWNAASEPFEIICQIPKQLGKGYVRDIEVYPQLWLSISDYKYHDDVLLKAPARNHPVQFSVLLSGMVGDGTGEYFGGGYTLISGSGVQRAMTFEIRKSQHVGIDIHMQPDLLATFFPTHDGQISPELSLLVKANDWQTLLYPETTTAINFVAQQMINCPYQGMTKRIYLQAKVLELMALQLAPILADQGGVHSSGQLKAQTIARLNYAREILLSSLENPPSILELAQQVGVSDRTLRRGFQKLFGTTVFGYLTDKRMEWAEQLLRQGNTTVAAVANRIGYSHQGRFALTFKRKYGITPSECFLGKMSVSEP